jgi:uncharacterized SAM-binding protein YcdF (DUF218 family)
LLNQLFNFQLLYRLLTCLIIAFTSSYLILFTIISLHARQLLTSTLVAKYDAALILGNRTNLHGAPNPCLAGRVDKGLLLAEQGIVSTLAMTGGRDNENSRIEAEFMAAYAKDKGYKGLILIEPRSRSTKENLEFSAPILKAANIKTMIIVSEPYHLWRTEKLVAAGHLVQALRSLTLPHQAHAGQHGACYPKAHCANLWRSCIISPKVISGKTER